MNASDLLRTRASLTPNREALLELATGRRFTFATLNLRANRLADFLLKQLGIQGGDRISILAHNSVAYVDLFYAAGKTGAILAPFNWRLVGQELAYIASDCQPRALFVGPEFLDMAREIASRMPGCQLIGLEGAEIPDAVSYEEALDGASDKEPAPLDLSGDAPYCLLYTSGTTGRPKGAMISHNQVLWNCINTVASWGLTEHDVSPIFVPLFHAGGLFAFLTPLLYIGGRIVLARSLDVEESLRVIEQEGCTVILGVPTIYRMWLDSPTFPQADFRHVRWFVSGGAPCPRPLIDAWREAKGIVFRQGYGLTEVGPNCFTMTDEESVLKTGSVGKPLFHSRMRIVDDKDRDVPVGEVGELAIYGPHICSGYWNNPDATEKAIRNGWFYTGDMAWQDSDEFYYIVGRFKDMIISGGENIYAIEVEAVFLEHPDVAEAALIGKPDEKFGEVGLMVVVPRAAASPTEEDLLRACEGKLARYKVPKHVVFTEALPYSPYGKVQKATLRNEFLSIP
uniref:Fatty-acyl-CoA synthase n=1 Tax=Candidatus Kentrum eta TaxID=2126337 RepID=A0A450UW14_9GAMM|nr:MAG: fatty-acyl-CoA synthase [Candidatus Kentron sp. H]VFJ97350.1 MAG: fatty-acyl-CoA synthase [Candidatus Kentron sp. H]VFK02676.1 MAG: fatty-acyl-CoA synthase [Candidatus Kentron sp. H]